MRKLALGFLFLAAVGALAARSAAQTPPPAAPPAMEMIALPMLEGFDSCSARAVNNRGQVIGYCDRPNAGGSHAFVWENGVTTDLGTLGGISSLPYAINDQGQIVGSSFTESWDVVAFLWEKGSGMKAIAQGENPASGSQFAYAMAINEGGQVAGTRYMLLGDEQIGYQEGMQPFLWDSTNGARDIGGPELLGTQPRAINNQGRVLLVPSKSSGSKSAWLWQDGASTQLKPLSDQPYDNVYGSGLNEVGQVAGTSGSDPGSRATLWTAGQPSEIPMPSGGFQSWGLGINTRGDIFGNWQDSEGVHGFFWDGVSATDLGFEGGGSISPQAMNNLGQVVGGADYTQHPEQGVQASRAFLWQGGVLTDLGALSSDEDYSFAADVNDLGQVVGESRTASGALAAVLWRPLLTPEQKIEALIKQVKNLVTAGALAKGPGNALVVSLEAALKKLAQGNGGAACNTLHAFANKVEAFTASGTLRPADGAALLAAVNAVIAQLCG